MYDDIMNETEDILDDDDIMGIIHHPMSSGVAIEKMPRSYKPEKLLKSFDEEFFCSEGKDIIKHEKLCRNSGITEGVHLYNGKIWELQIPNSLEGKCHSILERRGVNAVVRKKAKIAQFFSAYEISEDEFNIDGENLFVIKNGIIDLRKLKDVYQNFTEEERGLATLLERKSDWFFPHELYKENHLTTMAPVSIPDVFDEAKFKCDMAFIKETMLKSLGQVEESYEWINDLLSLCLSGIRKGDFFVNFFGRGGSGKTTFINFFSSVFGEDYFRVLATTNLFDEKNSSLNKLYRRKYARIINVSEPNDSKINASFLKKLTGDSKLTVGYDEKQFKINAQIIIDSNFIIDCQEVDKEAFMRRYSCIPWGPAIQETAQDKELPEKLRKTSESFFLNLIERYAKSDIPTFHKPAISFEVQKTISLFKNPIDYFFNTFCVAATDTLGGEEKFLSDIKDIFETDFRDYYEANFNNLFYKSEQFHRNLLDITASQFNRQMKLHHRNYDDRAGRRLRFNNIIVRKPGPEKTTMEAYVEYLKQSGIAKNDMEALEKISEAGKTFFRFSEEPDGNFDDIKDLPGDFSFLSFGLSKYPSKIAWKNTMGFWLLNNVICNSFHLRDQTTFYNWLLSISGNKYQQIRSALYESFLGIRNCCDILTNEKFRDCLSILFDLYVKFARNKLRKNNP